MRWESIQTYLVPFLPVGLDAVLALHRGPLIQLPTKWVAIKDRCIKSEAATISRCGLKGRKACLGIDFDLLAHLLQFHIALIKEVLCGFFLSKCNLQRI